jgi:uncharacterized protein YbcC (UPF0753/DUF2309 family)
MVAVNPFHGFADQRIEQVATRFQKINRAKLFHSLAHYRDLFLNQEFDETHIQLALDRQNGNRMTAKEVVLDLFRNNESELVDGAKTITEHCAAHYTNDLVEFQIQFFSNWMAYTTANNPELKELNLVHSFVNYAQVNKSPQFFGIKHFKTYLNAIDSSNYMEFFERTFDFKDFQKEPYLLRLLYTLPGWASYLRGLDWDNELNGCESNLLVEFMYAMLCWEYILLQIHQKQGIELDLVENIHRLKYHDVDTTIRLKSVLQSAIEIRRTEQLNQLIKQGSCAHLSNNQKSIDAQLVFCIDVRSEVVRRNIEALSDTVETKGFAGFFGLPINYTYLGKNNPDSDCPVLLKPTLQVHESMEQVTKTNKIANRRGQWSFTQQMITLFKRTPFVSFGFVSPLGLFYLPKILSDAFSWTKPIHVDLTTNTQEIIHCENFPLEEQKTWALSTLKNMGFTHLSKLICFIGHGTSTTNNPQNAGLTCGACGGHSGDKNALLAAQILNQPEIKDYLRDQGFPLQADTHFIAGFHNTTTDEITLLNEPSVPSNLSSELSDLKKTLHHARMLSVKERSNRMKLHEDGLEKIALREKDWSEVVPELGLANCHHFIVANRSKTKGVDLKSSSFLHDYNWENDTDFQVLENIMTAPMIVTTWINLQYYASSIDNTNFGSGNKVLHNVINTLGVIEGNSGDLKVGLAMQSVHSIDGPYHDPMRLNVIIDAPYSAIVGIVEKHDLIKQLVDNHWITIHQLDENMDLQLITTRKVQEVKSRSKQLQLN